MQIFNDMLLNLLDLLDFHLHVNVFHMHTKECHFSQLYIKPTFYFSEDQYTTALSSNQTTDLKYMVLTRAFLPSIFSLFILFLLFKFPTQMNSFGLRPNLTPISLELFPWIAVLKESIGFMALLFRLNSQKLLWI